MASINEITQIFVQNFTVKEGLILAKPLGFFILGLAIYAFFIFKFYKFLARRDIFTFMNQEDGEEIGESKMFFSSIFYVLKHLIIFPFYTMFWVVILSVILAFLARNTEAGNILLISVGLIAVIRITSYYNEDLSKDLAKMMPFALLGIFLIDISYFSLQNSLQSIFNLVGVWKLAIYYLIMLTLLELILRILQGVGITSKKTTND